MADLYSKVEVSSPPLSMEGFWSTLVINAAENKHITIADVADAFLKANMEDVKLQGPAVDVLLKINNNRYKSYVIKKGKNKVLYFKLLKTMYGTLKAPLLWFMLFANTLKEEGFDINSYDNYVANKTINDKFTIFWYVDDIKFSHKDKQVVEDIIEKIENKFDKMSIAHENVQKYIWG